MAVQDLRSRHPAYTPENLPDWEAFCRCLDLTSGFLFGAVLVPDREGEPAIRALVADHLGSSRSLRSYEIKASEPTDALVNTLLEPHQPEAVFWVSIAPGHDPESSWRRVLSIVNQNRNTISAHRKCPLILCGPPALREWLRDSAPDLWSIRTAVFELSPVDRTAIQHRPRNLPYPSLGILFKGRDTFLADLKKQLTTAHATVIRGAQAIHGMGGVGKTRAAVEYAWAHEADYTALLFINADSPGALTRNLAALTGPLVLNLPEHAATDTSVQVRAVLTWLQQHPGWFLIIDNVDTPDAQNAVTALLAQLPDGHIVITSRLADWAAGVTALDLDVLSEKSSIEFLIERTAERRFVSDDDPATAKTIAQNLGYLALALEQSAAYIRAKRCSFGDYLRDWETKRFYVLAMPEQNRTLYPRSIAITFDTSVALLSEDARTLLHILSWLAPDPMPMVHLENLNALPEPRALLIHLADLHLANLSADGMTFSIHRLLQNIARQQQLEKKPQALIVALQWINGEMPTDTDDVRTWPIAIPLLPHAIATATFAADRDISDPPVRLLNCAANLLIAQANYRAAEPLMRRALALDEAAFGNNHPEVATDLNNLASLLQDTNRLAEAEPLMRRALVLDEAAFGSDHPKIAIRLNNLASLLKATNRLTEAEPLMRRALVLDEAAFGNDHPEVATDLNNLASLLQATNRLAEAEPLMRRALTINEASLGNNHPNVARDLNNLASLLQDTNRLAEAEPLMRRALGIWQVSLGENHPNVAAAISNLASLLQDTNRLTEAEPLMRRALAIDEAALGKDHPNVAIRLNNLALLLEDTNRLAEAEPMMKDAVRIFENSFGPEHPDSVLVRKNLEFLQNAIRNAQNPWRLSAEMPELPAKLSRILQDQ